MTDILLPSWNDTATKRRILDFLAQVTTGPDAVPVEQRIAVFDNDGTLWTEKPMPTQLHFIIMQWAEAARRDPSLAEEQPYKAVVSGDYSWLGKAVEKHYEGDDDDLHVLVKAIVASTAGVDVGAYAKAVATFYREQQHPVLKRPYRDTVYRPMVELLRALESHDFTCFIVSGGDRDFMRPMTTEYYGIPPERVIGSAVGLTWSDDGQHTGVRYGNSFSFMDDGPEKPVRIWSRIGRAPIFAAGNSNGDVAMLRYATSGPLGLGIVVRHDDSSDRGDVAYTSGAEEVIAAAATHNWVSVSVKDDWNEVFRGNASAFSDD
ncbi:HAD family hydrolase [Lysinibacter cavernae]|uniref:Phosphoserine phosphatase n=1 Tax=Lysinibacter cavernae TaxID=1640652 RepID=A0A7X5R3V9_9MICO|nr:HAD family hydrolase [Lysinibacter cavernae]NIH55077.1 phosphoserine phosphatase [Lysinibacter cavernae]